MDPDKSFRKKQRAVLNTLREVSIYRGTLVLSSETKTLTVITLELKETGLRDLEEKKTLVAKVLSTDEAKLFFEETKGTSLQLRVEDRGQVLLIPVISKNTDALPSLQLEFSIQDLKDGNRRRANRESIPETFFVPVMLYFNDENLYPVSAFARVNDYQDLYIGFELRIGMKLSEDEIKNAKVVFQKGSLPIDIVELSVDQYRDFRVEAQFDDFVTTLTVVSQSKTGKLFDDSEPVKSLIQPKENETIYFNFRIFLKEISDLRVKVHFITTVGFVGEFEEPGLKLPLHFAAEHSESHLRFSARLQNNHYHFQITSQDLGHRVQWYNFLTHAVLKFQYQFKPDDAKDITRLMLESGNYSQKAISEMVLSHGYLQANWPVEISLSKTKYRWLVKDDQGQIIGHTSGLRVSETLWAAIDNIGSQSYNGSWNKEFVSKWLRSFQEILETNKTKNYIQWNFSPKAGVWNKFDETIIKNKSLFICRDRFWGLFINNYNLMNKSKNHSIETHEIDYSTIKKNSLYLNINRSHNFLIDILYDYRINKSFINDYVHDNNKEFKRFSYLITINKIPQFLLSFTNYSTWSSLNKGHDLIYLFPLEQKYNLNKETEIELLTTIKDLMFSLACNSLRVALISETAEMHFGSEWINLILKPPALELASKATLGEL